MDCRQARREIRRRALGLCNGLVRRVLSARSDSFTWNVDSAGLRYCEDSEPTPSIHQFVSYTQHSLFDFGNVVRLRDDSIDSSFGFASMRERKLFQIELLAVKQLVLEPITPMTLAVFEKDQILQTLSDLRGRQISVTNYRTTFIQYLQLCRLFGIQFKISLANNLTQCLSCLQHSDVPFAHFKCECLIVRFNVIQDCNCHCGTSRFCCTCDVIPQMCYDLDVLADIVTVLQRSLEVFFFRTDQLFMEDAMSHQFVDEFLGVRGPNVSTPIRLSQFEPP